MTKDELVAKQQREIEDLKQVISEQSEAAKAARSHLVHIQQWSPEASEFPSVAMKSVCLANDYLQSV